MKGKGKSSVKDKVIISICSIVIAVSLLSVAGVFVLNTRFFASTGEEGGNRTELNSDVATPTDIKEKSVTFLVAGIDYMEGTTRGKLTDVVMVVNFDIEGKKINVLQIPRDTYIGDDYPTGKINAVYGQKTNGGINGLINRINKTLNIPIDHYVTINMDGFIKVIDAIGGVEVDVPITFDLEGYHIEKGLQTLDGKHAEILVRERHSYANQDLGRIQTQQIFLEALIQKAFSLSFSQAVSLAPVIIGDITTDLTVSDLLGFYQNFTQVSPSDIRFHLLPVVGATSNQGLSVLSIKRYPTADLLNGYFRPYMSPVAAEDLGIIELVKDYDGASSSYNTERE